MRSRKAENSISAGHLSGSESLLFNENTWTQTTSIQKQMFTLPKSWIACGHALKTSFNTLSQHVGNYILCCLAIVTPPLSPTCPQPVSWNLLRKSKNNREISAWWSFSVILIWKLLATQTAHAHYLWTLLYVMVMERPISQRVMQDANSSLTGYMYRLVWTRKKANPYISIILTF